MTKAAANAADVGKRLKSIVDYVRDCQARVTKGEIMDLQGLDKNVIDLCNDLATLPEPDALALETQMTQLIDQLEVLARTMKDQQDKIAAAGR